MSIREQLLSDLQRAMKDQDVPRRSTLRLLRAAIADAEIQAKQSLNETDELKVIAREAKRRRDAIEEYMPLGRLDLVEQARTELAIIENYLPKQVSREEVEEVARQVIADIGGKSSAPIGEVMRRMMAQLKNRVDGRVVSQVVQEMLDS